MAKAQSTSAAPAPKTLVTRPGLKKSTGDVVGFHDCETQGHIYGIPRGAKLNDSKLEPKKPSAFVIFELLEDCEVTEGSGDDGVIVKASKGDMVGVWTKGGMRNLRNMCGLSVLMQHTGEKVLKDRPKAQSPMKTFQFDTDESPTKRGMLIPVIEDNRKESRDVVTMFDRKSPAMREPGADESEDPGF